MPLVSTIAGIAPSPNWKVLCAHLQADFRSLGEPEVHEGSHVIVCLASGLRVRGATVVPGRYGRGVTELCSGGDEDGEIVAALGGAIGPWLFLPLPGGPRYSRGDEECVLARTRDPVRLQLAANQAAHILSERAEKVAELARELRWQARHGRPLTGVDAVELVFGT